VKVLLIEDNYFAASLSEYLKDHGINAHRAQNLIEAEGLLENEGSFDAAIVDLDMNKFEVPLSLLDHTRARFVGWVYYQHVLRQIPPLSKNTIILSALLYEFRMSTPKQDYEHLALVDKGDSDCLKQVRKELNRFNEKPKKESEEDKAT